MEMPDYKPTMGSAPHRQSGDTRPPLLPSILDQASYSQERVLQKLQPLTAQEPTPPRQYTTVGSVYNPQTQPLQPPVRRGRTVKTLIPYQDESSAGSSQLPYTPLQQNSERAISPLRSNADASLPNVIMTQQERQVLQKFGVVVHDTRQAPNMSGLLESTANGGANALSSNGNSLDTNQKTSLDPTAAAAAAGNSAATSSHAEPGGGSNGADIMKSIATLNFNSLSNLASYPNPMQRAAQLVLASHRPQPNASGGLPKTDGRPVQPWMKSKDPGVIGPPPLRRGAPAPLTAGPPGVRQVRPTALDQEILQRPREFDDENPMMNPVHQTLPSVRRTIACPTEGGHARSVSIFNLLEDDYSDCPDENEDGDKKKRRKHAKAPVDTLPAEELTAWFTEGLPPDFNHQKQPSTSDWLFQPLSEAQRPVSVKLAEHLQHVEKKFYGGYNKMFNKTVADAVMENNRRTFSRVVGRRYEEPPSDQEKVVNRQISVHDASQIPASEHAAPLLSMAFQSIINHPNFAPDSTLPKFEKSLYPSYLGK